MDKIKAILFDLDNTLLDRDTTFRSFSMRFIADHFQHLDPEDQQRLVEDMIERDADGYRDKDGFFQELSEVFPWEAPVSAAQIREYYDARYNSHHTVMDGAAECLNYLRERGYALGLVTNGKSVIQRQKIEILGLGDLFKAIVISGEAGISKPDPAIYRMSLDRLGYGAEETVFIGDHPVNDIWGAGRAGMQGIWLRRRHPWDERLDISPWRTIDALRELRQLL